MSAVWLTLYFVVGGIVSSTLLDQIVTPALYFRFGRRVDKSRLGAAPAEIEVPRSLREAAGA